MAQRPSIIEAEQQTRLVAIVDSCYDAIIGKNCDQVITSWNPGAVRIYGYTAEEALGKTAEFLLPPGQASEEPEVVRAIATGTRLEQFETVRRRKDGRSITVSMTISPIADAQGKVIGSSSIERDVTERKRSEEELRAAKEEAERANRVRSEFLANVSHELRTPMNAILGMTQLALADPDLSEVLRDYIKTAQESAESLLTLLNDILDFSKLESGRFTIEEEPFHLRNVVEETVRAWSSPAFEKGLELACELDPDLPDDVLGDEIRLRQILSNLLSNAIKFTDQGEVVITVKVIQRWPNEVRLHLAVSDTGVGISPDDQSQIFEPFTQVDASSTRRHGGTGLGLAICRELLRLMGGRLSVTSQPGEGSTFSFTLSLATPHRASETPIDRDWRQQVEGLRVLVVDDNETNRKIISRTLSGWKMQVDTARDAEQAFGMLRRAQDQQEHYPLVIVDALMPGVDGYQLSQAIYEQFNDAAPPVILMVSSADRRAFRDLEETAHISVYLQKPVSPTDLTQAVSHALQMSEPLTPNLRPMISDPPKTTLTVLVAEDTPANQKVVASVLKRRGHAVIVAQNGREAVELVKRNEFDVLLMDIQMPIVDGFQATAAIRTWERESNRKTTPIVAITAHAMRGDRERCLEAGMDAYIAKPIDIVQLVSLVESVVHTPMSGRAQESSPPPPPDLSAIIDIQGALKRLGQDRDLYREFIRYYDEDAPKLVRKIQRAVEKSDATALEMTAHGLKGLAANLGAVGVVRCATALEQSGRAANLTDTPRLLVELLDEVHRLDDALVAYRY